MFASAWLRCPGLLRPGLEQRLRAVHSAAPLQGGLLELREYTLKPAGIKTFMKVTSESMALRRQLLPLLGYVLGEVHGR